MLRFAISAETSGPIPLPGRNNNLTELTAVRFVTVPDNQLYREGVYTRSDGQSVNNKYSSTTDEMVQGRPAFVTVVKNLEPLFYHKDPKTGEYDTLFICFNAGFYQELFRRYGIVRDGLFVDMLPLVRDLRDTQAVVNMPSRAAGSKLPSIPEVAEFLGSPAPVTPKDKTDLLCEVYTWAQAEMNRNRYPGGMGMS